MRRGQAVEVSVEATGAVLLKGVVDSISPAADPRTQGYTVKIRIDNPGSAVRPGMFARVRFPVEKRDHVLVVPNSAVITEAGVDSVLEVADGVVKKTSVQVGISDDSVTEILSGLDEGALVVTEGQSFLNEGEKVAITRAAE
jgi:HlyD family secretion protein